MFSRKGIDIMSTTEPIRDIQKLLDFKNYYLNVKPNLRNYTIIILGLNTALRISDILNLTCDDIYLDGYVREHITVREQKTGKENRILLNREAKSALANYRRELVKTELYRSGNPYLFPSPRKAYAPVSRSQVYRMITAAAEAVGIEGHISCHSLRKTFGYHAWKQGSDPVVIMVIFNHSSKTADKNIFEKIKKRAKVLKTPHRYIRCKQRDATIYTNCCISFIISHIRILITYRILKPTYGPLSPSSGSHSCAVYPCFLYNN